MDKDAVVWSSAVLVASDAQAMKTWKDLKGGDDLPKRVHDMDPTVYT